MSCSEFGGGENGGFAGRRWEDGRLAVFDTLESDWASVFEEALLRSTGSHA